MDRRFGTFVWDVQKEAANLNKHGISFELAARVFKDPNRKIFIDEKHGRDEERLFCIGKVGSRVLTVRFTLREGKIRIYGAGNWRRGRRYYDQASK